jgi:ribonuclease Z
LSIKYRLLGKPGRDNGLFVWVDSGTEMHRLLFDCGEGILEPIKVQDVKGIDHLFLSHLHVDHLSGFDYYFRRNFDRQGKSVIIWGPERTGEIIHNRLRGFMWNLISDWQTKIVVNEIVGKEVICWHFFSSEAFKIPHKADIKPFNKILVETKHYKVEAALLNHQIPSVAYRVSEKIVLSINKQKMKEMNIESSPLLGLIKKEDQSTEEEIREKGLMDKVQDLRGKLLTQKPGDSIGYLTDFIYDQETEKAVVDLMKGCRVMVCESQYIEEDQHLAKRNFHLTSTQAATLARICGVEKLIIFHISERYTNDNRMYVIIEEAKEIFYNTHFPDEWEEW